MLAAYNGTEANVPKYVESSVRWRQNNAPYDAYEEDMAEVVFFFNRPVTSEFLSLPRMTFFDYVSSVGGLLGLFMGFSIISLVEILYWITVGIGEHVHRERQLRKKSGVQTDGPLFQRKASNPK